MSSAHPVLPPHSHGRLARPEGALDYTIDGDAGAWITLIRDEVLGPDSWQWQRPTRTKPNLAALGRLLGYDAESPGDGADAVDVADLVDHGVAEVLALWDHLGVRRSVLVGSQVGAMVGLTAALRHPDRVAGLVLEGCGRLADDARRTLIGHAAAVGSGRVEDYLTQLYSPQFVADQPEVVEERTARLSAAGPAVVATSLRALAEWTVPAEVGSIGVPAVVISGAADVEFGSGAAADLARLLPAATHVRFPRSGRAVHLEHAPGFAHVVTELVDRCA